jgi:hypothetical protein
MDQSQILTQLQIFFPLMKYTSENIHVYIESDELDIFEKSLANTLKGALLNESIVEVELYDFEKVFFCRIVTIQRVVFVTKTNRQNQVISH